MYFFSIDTFMFMKIFLIFNIVVPVKTAYVCVHMYLYE